MNKTSPTLVQGFTLIEMTVVLLLITLLASVAIRETNSLSFQVRYEQTQERLERIREAILGNPRQIINGQQAVSGFVADMGRLPDELRELLQPGFCYDSGGTLLPTIKRPSACTSPSVWTYKQVPCSDGISNTETLCSEAAATWIGRNSDSPGLSWGWQGPYLNVSGNPDDKDAFVDGWGRVAQGKCTNIVYTDETTCTANGATWTLLSNDNNYGWWFIDLFNLTNNASDSGNLIVQSFGKNHQKDNSIPTTGDYENDYPSNNKSNGAVFYPNPIVRQQDWQIDISNGITINLLKPYQSLGGFCGFLASQASSFTALADCKNAGGSCTDTSPNDGNCDSICAISSSTCKDLGGKWQSCFFTSDQCNSFTGGTWQESCEFTPSSCVAPGVGGTWNTTDRVCNFTSATCPTTWDGSKCVFTENTCFNNHGTWQKQCKFSNQTDCERIVADGGPGGTWNMDNPASCSFTLAQCNTANGLTKGKDCNITNEEGASSTITRYSQQNCNISSGTWTSNIKQLCLRVFYRNNGTITSIPSNSKPVLIEENGSSQTIHFNFASNPIFIPAGQNAIGIYEHDGTNCTSTLYPADRQNPIQVDFHPRIDLPVINW
ncbi:prepilin-type N-terminal cleavage/methylation domain-containing protein [Methylobacter sp. Wu1]|uniref:prepilin-type N-terminal cleavage/methylation domain-containing protein n=1 Tax=Methylobacter sp. Wu1 TaxID=3119359 RepID=UPI002F91D1AD